MQVQFKLTIGENEFTLVDTVESHTDFFKKMSFYSTLPKVGPNGETDLVIQHRVAQKQYDYYSIISQKAGMEFRFGQAKDAKGTLFAKGWEPIYKGDGTETEGQTTGAPTAGLGAAAAQPAQTQTSTPTAGLGAPRSAPTPAPAAPSTVQTNAKNVLAKFGI